MLEIKLERAYEPEMIRKQPCGVCGAEFEPNAVLAILWDDRKVLPICEVCLVCFSHFVRRAEEEPIPARWDEVYQRYLELTKEYTEPVFPSAEAVLEAEARNLEGTSALMEAAENI